MHGTLDIDEPENAVAAFYATRRGAVAADVLRDRLAAFWPDARGMDVLGIGYATPYLKLWQPTAYRCIDAIAAPLAPATAGHACVVAEDRLPFPDLTFDRVLLVHAVEHADDCRRLLREVWRVLKDDGRLLVVAPNRLGLWAHVEATPFGHGTPFSPRQITGLLASAMFRPERRDVALFVPPVDWSAVLRGWPVWEQVGHAVASNLAGVTLTEAIKDAYSALPLPLGATVRRQVMAAEPVYERGTATLPAAQHHAQASASQRAILPRRFHAQPIDQE
jgi:SAM-dependent methyltransferase